MGAFSSASVKAVRTPVPSEPDAPLLLIDASAASGLVFTHEAAEFGAFYIPEEMGPGVALFDADGDGDLDVYLVQGGRLAERGVPAPIRLFRNDGDGTFTDVTEQRGAGDETYGMGVAAALSGNRLQAGIGSIPEYDDTARHSVNCVARLGNCRRQCTAKAR